MALINAGKTAEPEALLEKLAARRATPDPTLVYLLAEAQRADKDLPAAEATAPQLLAAEPRRHAGAARPSLVQQDQGDDKGAEATLRDLVSKAPDDAIALNSLGYMLAERGDRLDEAVQLVQRALKIDPDNPSYLDSLGWAYFQQGKLHEADQPLTQAAEKLQTSSVVQEHLGDLRFKQQRFSDAATAWETGARRRRAVNRSREGRAEDPRRALPPGPEVTADRIGRRTAGVARAFVLSASLVLAACAAKPLSLPSEHGAPSPDAPAAYVEATSQCRGVKSLSAELALSGRAAGTKLRGRIVGGFAAPGKIRLEAPAPFGRPVFTLVARGETATLVLNRNRRVVRDASPAALVEALAGVSMGPDNLRGAVAGCGFSGADLAGGEWYPGDWIAGDAGGARAWLRKVDGAWRLVATARGPLESGTTSSCLDVRQWCSCAALPRAIRQPISPSACLRSTSMYRWKTTYSTSRSLPTHSP